MSDAWPDQPPALGTRVDVSGSGGSYNIRALDGMYLVSWGSGLGSEIRPRSDGGFDVLITNGTASEEHTVATWAEAGDIHP